MLTQLTQRRRLDCTPWTAISRFLGDPGGWLPAPAQPVEDRWLVTVHAGPVSWTVCVCVGEPESPPEGYARTLQWVPRSRPQPRDHGALPELEGVLLLREEPGGRPVLVFRGHYQAPGGTVGAVIDLAGLHALAETTIRRLLADIAERLTAEATVRV